MRGGARIGGFNASYPFATFSADAHSLILTSPGRELCIPRESIRRLGRHRGMLSVGLRIEHVCATAPGEVIFWASLLPFSRGFKNLKAQLIRLGYAVND